MRIRSLPVSAALVAGVLAAAVLSPIPSLADGPIHLDLEVGSRCVSGHKTTDEPIKVKLLRHDGSAIETRHDDTSELAWSVCFHHRPVAGNRFHLINGTRERLVTVPDLTLDVDRVTSVVRGHGPAGKALEVGYNDCYPSLSCLVHSPVSVTVNSHGRFHRDLTSASIDIDGDDEVTVVYQNAHQDRFFRVTTAPYFTVTKPDRVTVSCVPRGATTVRITSSSGALRAAKTFHATSDCGLLSGSFRKDGHAVNVHIGDRVSSDLATDARLVWPAMSVNGSGDQLSGRCLASSRVGVLVIRGGAPTPVAATTDADGHFSVTVPSWTFQAGDTLELICETSRGDRVRIIRTL
jgi:hypothetical protein